MLKRISEFNRGVRGLRGKVSETGASYILLI
jgi:hypothetical protein